MSICSLHQVYQKDCKLCNTHARDILPDWDEKVAEAKAAGETTCAKCGFVYYLTTDTCPLCQRGGRITVDLCEELKEAVNHGKSAVEKLLKSHVGEPHFEDLYQKAKIMFFLDAYFEKERQDGRQ